MLEVRSLMGLPIVGYIVTMTPIFDEITSMFHDFLIFPGATSHPSCWVLAPPVAVEVGAEAAAIGPLPLVPPGGVVLGRLLTHPEVREFYKLHIRDPAPHLWRFSSCSTFFCILAMDCISWEEDRLAMTPEVPLSQMFKHSLYSSGVAL